MITPTELDALNRELQSKCPCISMTSLDSAYLRDFNREQEVNPLTLTPFWDRTATFIMILLESENYYG